MKLITTLCLSLWISFSWAQESFSGVVHYRIAVIERNPSLMGSKPPLPGETSKFYYKNGNYLQMFAGGVLDFEYFNTVENKYYLKSVDSDTFQYYDSREDDDQKLIKLESHPDTKRILGKRCTSIALTAQNLSLGYHYRMKFYYADQPRVDASVFKGHKHGFIDQVYGSTGAIPLEIDFEMGEIIIRMTAIKIEAIPAEKLSLGAFFEKKKKECLIIEGEE